MLGAVGAGEPLGHLFLQDVQAPNNFGIFESTFAGVVPRNDIDGLLSCEVTPLALAYFLYRSGDALIHTGTVESGQFDEIDRRDAFAEALAHGFVTDVFFPFATTVGTGEVTRGEHGEEKVRFAESLGNAPFPVGHARYVVAVEEDANIASSELVEVFQDGVAQFSDLATSIVPVRVGNEKVVRHWSLLQLLRRSLRTAWRTSSSVMERRYACWRAGSVGSRNSRGAGRWP